MFRPTVPADALQLLALTAATGYFKPHEVETLDEVFVDYFKEARDDYGHLAFTWEEDGRPVGFVYYAPTEMTDRTWELWWIVVDPSRQGRGLGREMLRLVEDDIRRRDGRILLIETSSTPHYEPTRRFYLKNGYTLAAQVADYYADADDKVIFSRRLSQETGDRTQDTV